MAEPRDDCWPWPGGRTLRGYGQLRIGTRLVRAHRAIYEAAVGPIPDGMVVRHRCDNPPCINPHHLELGTQADNMADAVDRGRMASGERNGRTKLTAEQVADLRRRWAEDGVTQAALSAEYGISSSQVSRICTGRRRAQ